MPLILVDDDTGLPGWVAATITTGKDDLKVEEGEAHRHTVSLAFVDYGGNVYILTGSQMALSKYPYV